MTTEKANEYAIESLKQIITLSSAILVLTITFLKDLLGSGRDDVKYAFLVPFGWASLLIGILLALMAIIGAADALGDGSTSTTGSPPSLPPGQTASQTANYVFKRNGGGVASLGQFLLAVVVNSHHPDHAKKRESQESRVRPKLLRHRPALAWHLRLRQSLHCLKPQQHASQTRQRQRTVHHSPCRQTKAANGAAAARSPTEASRNQTSMLMT
jgi:hypothetical protein